MKNNKWTSVVLWSVISAAFIGPGTVTTAVTAGSLFKIDLLWAIVFATIACIILQEVAARITIATGLNLGQALTIKFGLKHGRIYQYVIGGSVLAGCAAYEAGNILGAVSGIQLMVGGNGVVITSIITLLAFLALWIGNPKWISNIMMLLVIIMGVAFFWLASSHAFSIQELSVAAVLPKIPLGSEMVVLGLVGTTIVPYNIFLGSGISKGQTVPLMRLGLTISVLIGGMITAAIMVAGTVVNQFSSFPELYDVFQIKIGLTGSLALALGLFAAGFSSAITSPFAASIITRTVFGVEDKARVRLMWIVVLLTGFFFGVSGIKPIPVILVVQALNGLILPLLTVVLVLLVNDSSLIPKEYRHSFFYNIVLLVILGVVLLIGLSSVDKALLTTRGSGKAHFEVILSVTLLVVMYVAWIVFAKRKA
jgi:Mn2+/Fe2+ NRAMP family transporter